MAGLFDGPCRKNVFLPMDSIKLIFHMIATLSQHGQAGL